MRTKRGYSNCLFGLLYLILRGKAKRVVLAPGGNVFVPWHMGVLTPQGHFLNFRRVLPHSENHWGAWWYLGSFQGLSRNRWRHIIGRDKIVHIVSVWLALISACLIYLLFLTPYVVTCACYIPAWTIWGSIQALRRRRK